MNPSLKQSVIDRAYKRDKAKAGAVAAPYVSNAIDYVYGTWVTETNDLWVSPDPAGS